MHPATHPLPTGGAQPGTQPKSNSHAAAEATKQVLRRTSSCVNNSHATHQKSAKEVLSQGWSKVGTMVRPTAEQAREAGMSIIVPRKPEIARAAEQQAAGILSTPLNGAPLRGHGPYWSWKVQVSSYYYSARLNLRLTHAVVTNKVWQVQVQHLEKQQRQEGCLCETPQEKAQWAARALRQPPLLQPTIYPHLCSRSTNPNPSAASQSLVPVISMQSHWPGCSGDAAPCG